MHHSAGFLELVTEGKKHIHEITLADARAKLDTDPRIVLMDIREDHEWSAGHAAGAVHLGKGILERDLERLYPNVETEIIMYCGGGFRSVLACEAAQKLGYKKVHSLTGGYRAMATTGWPMKMST